jgi:glutaredoxin
MSWGVKMKRYAVLAGLLLVLPGSTHAATFSWVDASGTAQYGDVPAVEAVHVEKRKFAAAPILDDADLPYEVRLAKHKFPVTFYTYTECGAPCQQARDFLNKRGIPYSEKSLATQAEIEAFKNNSGGDTVPALNVGKAWLKNFELGQWTEQLDAAGYPKTAPYRPQGTPAKAVEKK